MAKCNQLTPLPFKGLSEFDKTYISDTLETCQAILLLTYCSVIFQWLNTGWELAVAEGTGKAGICEIFATVTETPAKTRSLFAQHSSSLQKSWAPLLNGTVDEVLALAIVKPISSIFLIDIFTVCWPWLLQKLLANFLCSHRPVSALYLGSRS